MGDSLSHLDDLLCTYTLLNRVLQVRKQSKKPAVSVRVCFHSDAIAMTSILFLF